MSPPTTPGVAVYNPDLLSDADLRAQFVARVELLDRLLDELRRPGPPQHHLLLGQRGMGKTTLLRRLRLAIEDDPALSARWTALSFPEEQYNIASLSDLWVNCLDALGDALERRGDAAAAARLDAQIDALPGAEGPRAEAALTALRAEAAARGGLVLLIDNLDLVLGRLHEHQWALRELLSEGEQLVFIGASSQLIDGAADYGAAFYDFFASHLLAGLTLDEAERVFLRLAELQGAGQVAAMLRGQPGRFKALHLLTGGNPRTMVLLFQIVAQDVNPNDPQRSVHVDLEALLDVCTPLYKARFEALASQAQQVVDALALGWDPMTAAELAAAARLEVNLASAQLNRLAKEGVVERVELPDTRRVGFQVAERFFNIWYLMRASRRVRRKLSWLVRFLEVLYGADGLSARAHDLLRQGAGPRHGELALAYAQAVHEPALRRALESDALDTLLTEPRAKLRELLDFGGEDAHLLPLVERKERLNRVREQILAANVDWEAVGCSREQMVEWVLGSSAMSLDSKELWFGPGPPVPTDHLQNLRNLLQQEHELRAQLFGGRASACLNQAIYSGLMLDLTDVDGAEAAATRFSCPTLWAMALLLSTPQPTQPPPPSLIDALQRALPGCDAPMVWRSWAHHAAQRNDWAEVERGFRMVTELNPADASAWSALGEVLAGPLERPTEAEAALRRAVELNPTDGDSWAALGGLLWKLLRIPEAEEALRRAIALSPNVAASWLKLGLALDYVGGPAAEAEAALRRAVELAPSLAAGWAALGLQLKEQPGRADEAELALRRSIELDQDDVTARVFLAELLIEQPTRRDEGVAVAREAARLRGDNARARNGLAWALCLAGQHLDEAAQLAAEATHVEPENADLLHTQAAILVRLGRWAEATAPLTAWLRRADDDHHARNWRWVLTLFTDACAHGHAGAAASLLEAEGYDQRWRPLYAALRAAEAGDPARLGRFAPEVAGPALELLARIAPEVAAAPPTLSTRGRPTRR